MKEEVGLGDGARRKRLSFVVQPAFPLLFAEEGFGALGEDGAVDDLLKRGASRVRYCEGGEGGNQGLR